jgi:hypothetical protein
MVMAPDLSLRGGAADVAISQNPAESRESDRRKRNCLSEIAPQGHFLALRAQGATSGKRELHQRPLLQHPVEKSKIAINPDFSGPISPFRLLSQKKSVMMEGRICNCIFHGRFCRCPAFFRCITQPRPVKTNEKQTRDTGFRPADCQKNCQAKSFGGKKSVKGNRQGVLSRPITRRSGRIAK